MVKEQKPVQQRDGKIGPDLPKYDSWKKRVRAGFCEEEMVPRLWGAGEEPKLLLTSSICDVLG